MNKIILKIGAVMCAGIIAAAGAISLSCCHMHDYTLVLYNEPTCVKNGIKKYQCSVCGEFKVEEVARTGEHLFERVDSPATCLSVGYSAEMCAYCGYCDEIEYLAPEHSFEDGVCSVCGGYEYGTDGLKFFVSDSAASLVAYTGTDKNVVVPVSVDGKNVINVLDAVFADRDDIVSVTLPKSVTYIGLRAFANCSSLKSVAGSENVVEIGDSAFENCGELSSFAFGENIALIEQNCFKNSGLTDVTLSSGDVAIGTSAFEGCKRLELIEASSSALTVGANAFAACERLKTVKLGLKSRNIGEGAFMGCSALEEIEGLDQACFIGAYAFAECGSLAAVNFGKRLNYIGRYAFKDCAALASAEFKEYDTSLAYYYADEAYTYSLIRSDENRPAGAWRAKALNGDEALVPSLSDSQNNAALLTGELCSCLWIVPASEEDVKKFLGED